MTADVDPTSDEGMRHRALRVVPILFVGAFAMFFMQNGLSAAPTPVSFLGVMLVLACMFWDAGRKKVFEDLLLLGGVLGWAIFGTLYALGIVVI